MLDDELAEALNALLAELDEPGRLDAITDACELLERELKLQAAVISSALELRYALVWLTASARLEYCLITYETLRLASSC